LKRRWLAKTHPGEVVLASRDVGTLSRLYFELFKAMTGINVDHVQYPINDPYFDLRNGRVQAMFAPLPFPSCFIRIGRQRALAVTTADRLAEIPNIPTVVESIAGYKASGSYGITAPAGTPAQLIDVLNSAINTGLVDSNLKQRFANFSWVPMPMTPHEFGKVITDDTAKWAKVISAAGITAE
jgi:tripartite-type tricarboxylate transporter receptor subunit TctC